MEDTINIKDLLHTLKKRWILILILTVGTGLASGLISHYVLQPVYRASTQILVNSKKTDDLSLNANQVQTNIQLVNTYSEIIKSPAILGKSLKKLNGKHSIGELNQKITVSSQENSQVLSLVVEDTNASEATRIANTVSTTFQTEIQDIMDVDNVSILSKSVLKENQNPIKPNLFVNIIVALFIGFIAGIGLAFLLEYMDNTIKNIQDVEHELQLPVIGSIQKN